MSSYYKRQKDYAKELLDKHVSKFHIDDTVELKYSIVSNKGMRKVDDELINYLSKETGLTSIQATDLVLSQYDEAKKKYNKMKKYHGYKKNDYTDRYRKATRKNYEKTIDGRIRLYNAIDKINMDIERRNYFKNSFNEETIKLIDKEDSVEGCVYMHYTEEELLEAVDILIEEYGFNEDEAIEMIAETYEMELYNEECDADAESERAMAQKRLVATAKPIAKGAIIGGTALAAHKLYKKHKAKKQLREDYGIFEDENGDLFIESEMVEAVMDEYDLYEEDAIDLIMECYEEELNEAVDKKVGIAGGVAAAGLGGALAYKAYKDSKYRVDRKGRKAIKAGKKFAREKEIRRTMDDVEKSRVRMSGGYRTMTDANGNSFQVPIVDNNYNDAANIVRQREAADKRVAKAGEKHTKAVKKYLQAADHYEKVQARKKRK